MRPGDIVVDLGAGTAIFGLLACRAGASRVYVVESTGMMEVARALAAANGVADRMAFIRTHSSEMILPERADVLVGDFAGHMGFEAGVFESYAHVRPWLKPDARVIPSSITIHAAAVEHEIGHREATFWREPVAGFDIQPVLQWSLNTGYPRELEPRHVLSTGTISTTAPTLSAPALLHLAGDVTMARAGTLHGIGGWFSAAMAPGVTMTNAPGDPSRIFRRNVFLPLGTPVPVAAGDTARLDIRIRPADMLVAWSVDGRTAAGAFREKHSTLNGMLISREDLRGHDPDSRPKLTARGAARLALLALCDGTHALSRIEAEMRARHADLFPTAAAAQAFVAETIAGYGRFEDR